LRPDAAGVHEVWHLHLAGEAAPVVVHVDGGRVAIDPPAAPPADHVVDARTPAAVVELTLAFPYGRRPAPHPAVARLATLFDPI
jgi:hypothetical protein